MKFNKFELLGTFSLPSLCIGEFRFASCRWSYTREGWDPGVIKIAFFSTARTRGVRAGTGGERRRKLRVHRGGYFKNRQLERPWGAFCFEGAATLHARALRWAVCSVNGKLLNSHSEVETAVGELMSV